MRKITFILFLIMFSLSFSNAQSNLDFEPLDIEQVKKDIDSMKPYKDSTVFYIKETGKIWAKEIKQNGFKATMKKGKDIFLPIVIVIILYLVWLKNRNK